MLNTYKPAQDFQQKLMQMFLDVPTVMASRIWMIATSPMNPQAQYNEINSMVTEKQKAFFDSVEAVNSQMLMSQMTLFNQFFKNSQDLMWGNYKSLNQSFNNFEHSLDRETVKILDRGLTPYANTVASNKERLTK